MKLKDIVCPQSDIESIHEASVKLLAEKGVQMPCETALNIFRKAGARIDNGIVYIKEEMLNQALSTVPPKFTIISRNSEYNFEIGGGNPCLCLPNGPINVKKGDQYWSSQSSDLINFLKLAENSPTINMVSPWVTTANDVPIEKQLYYQLAATLKYSTKPVLGLTAGYDFSKFSIKLIRDFYNCQNKSDFVALGLVSPHSPLSYDPKMLEAVIAYAEDNQPILFSSCVIPGATGPITIAGAIAIANTEMLAGIVLSQLIKPGVPIIYGNASGSADLRYATPAVGAPEVGQIAIYTRGLSSKYHMPCRAGGALSDSKKNDAQAGIESTMAMLSTIMSGQDFILHGGGILDSYNVISYDKFILDEEMTKMCLYLKNGIAIDEKSLAFETIMNVNHGGQYLMEKHTYKNTRTALYNSTYFEKRSYGSWENNGETTAQQNAMKAVEERLNEYNETPLTAAQNSLITEYLNV